MKGSCGSGSFRRAFLGGIAWGGQARAECSVFWQCI